MTSETTKLRHGWFVQFNFVSGVYRVWNGFKYRNLAGFTWSPVGAKGTIQQIDDPVSDTVPSIDMTITGVSANLLSKALSESNEIRGRMANIYDCYFDADWQPIGTLTPYSIVRMDTLKVRRVKNPDASASQTIVVTGEYFLTNGPCPPSGRYTSADQWARLGNNADKYFEFMAINQNRRQRWPQF